MDGKAPHPPTPSSCKTSNKLNVLAFCCTRCNKYQTNKFNSLLQHLKLIHSHEPYFSLRCGIDGCERVYHKIESYLSHVRRKHPDHKNDPVKDNDDYEEAPDISDQLTGNKHCEDSDDCIIQGPLLSKGETISLDVKERNIACMILKWQEKYQLPESRVNELLVDVTSVVRESHEQLSQNVGRCLEDAGTSLNEFPALKKYLGQSELADCLAQLQSRHSQLKYYESNFPFVQPVEVALGFGENGRTETFQYVPVLEMLRSLLLHDDIFTQVVSSPQKVVASEITSFRDGAYYQQNDLFNSNETSLQIILYNDDFEVSNPIGTFTKKQKINAMYFTIGNIHPKYRSKLHVIQLVWLCKSLLIQKYGLFKISELLIEHLQTLEEQGIKICKEGKEFLFHGTVSMIIADNLASHQLGGFMESFRANRICRFCMCTYEELKSDKLETVFTTRTEEVYNCHVELVQTDATLAGVYGMKFDSPFNKLQYFHVSRGLPPDPMHDLLEGVVPKVWREVLTNFVQRRLINIDQFNQSLAQFIYKGTDKAKKPSPLTWKSGQVCVKQTASQMNCLMKIGLLVLGDSIPPNDDYWQVLLYLADICGLAFSPRHNQQSITLMHALVKDFLDLYLELFKNGLIPKVHFLLHYADHIANFGPLVACSTMRFEGKHSYFKNLTRKTKNRKNLSLTLAKRHQLLQCYHALSPYFLESDHITSSGGSVCSLHTFPEDVRVVLLSVLGPVSEVFKAHTVNVNGVIYEENSVLVTGVLQNALQFSIVISIFMKDASIYFLVSDFVTTQYCSHYHANIVCPQLGKRVIERKDLIDFHPLEFYHTQVGICVPQRYRLLEEFL